MAGKRDGWIRFVKRSTLTRKTSVWAILAVTNGATLGYISWYSQWRRYCYMTKDDAFMVLDAECLRVIAQFCEDETNKYKGKIGLHT